MFESSGLSPGDALPATVRAVPSQAVLSEAQGVLNAECACVGMVGRPHEVKLGRQRVRREGSVPGNDPVALSGWPAVVVRGSDRRASGWIPRRLPRVRDWRRHRSGVDPLASGVLDSSVGALSTRAVEPADPMDDVELSSVASVSRDEGGEWMPAASLTMLSRRRPARLDAIDRWPMPKSPFRSSISIVFDAGMPREGTAQECGFAYMYPCMCWRLHAGPEPRSGVELPLGIIFP